MTQEIVPRWNVPGGINLILLLALGMLAAAGLGVSLVSLFAYPIVFGDSAAIQELRELDADPEIGLVFSDIDANRTLDLRESPKIARIRIHTPPLDENDSLKLAIVRGGGEYDTVDCLKELGEDERSIDLTEIDCPIEMAYRYHPQDRVEVYAQLEKEGSVEKVSAPLTLDIDWTEYEPRFWMTAFVLAGIAVLGMVLCAGVGMVMIFFAHRSHHEVGYEDEYGLERLLPWNDVRRALTHRRSLIVSPLFWAAQGMCILLLILFLGIRSEAPSSPSAMVAFALSGAFAFVPAFLLVALVWFADFGEREPLRVLFTLFLWGGLAGILSIGFNSTASLLFAAVGLEALTAFMVAPLVEETFKGMGLVVVSFHHEYDGIVDGILYGVVIGAGFSFVENWLYLAKTPLGADAGQWALLFFMRSILFAANHSVFTAFSGAAIGFLKSRRVGWAPFGLFLGMMGAMLLHAMHNSGQLLSEVCGPAGAIFYMLIIIPTFDFGGLLLLALLFAAGLYWEMKGKGEEKGKDKEKAKSYV